MHLPQTRIIGGGDQLLFCSGDGDFGLHVILMELWRLKNLGRSSTRHLVRVRRSGIVAVRPLGCLGSRLKPELQQFRPT